MRTGMAAIVVAAMMLVSTPQPAHAQLKGHYIPGFTGLGNGTQPPPSITLAVPIYTYPTDTTPTRFHAKPHKTASRTIGVLRGRRVTA